MSDVCFEEATMKPWKTELKAQSGHNDLDHFSSGRGPAGGLPTSAQGLNSADKQCSCCMPMAEPNDRLRGFDDRKSIDAEMGVEI